jgi:hypothetical protein
MPLIDIAIRAAKPAAKSRKIFDGGGLYLEISSARGQVAAAKVPLRRQRKAPVVVKGLPTATTGMA